MVALTIQHKDFLRRSKTLFTGSSESYVRVHYGPARYTHVNRSNKVCLKSSAGSKKGKPIFMNAYYLTPVTIK
jgi:hypothetical protein